jgi:hypothetical protein
MAPIVENRCHPRCVNDHRAVLYSLTFDQLFMSTFVNNDLNLLSTIMNIPADIINIINAISSNGRLSPTFWIKGAIRTDKIKLINTKKIANLLCFISRSIVEFPTRDRKVVILTAVPGISRIAKSAQTANAAQAFQRMPDTPAIPHSDRNTATSPAIMPIIDTILAPVDGNIIRKAPCSVPFQLPH